MSDGPLAIIEQEDPLENTAKFQKLANTNQNLS
jgi:hypothetical protein